MSSNALSVIDGTHISSAAAASTPAKSGSRSRLVAPKNPYT
jgi:hypothetical protein